MAKTFYITTPIYYANDEPHIGHAYTTILADVLARYHRAAGEEVFFLTGLDEHGQKVQQAAEKRGVDPKIHCNDMAPKWIQLWEQLHIRYDDFIRTTEPRHKKVVQAILEKVYAAGDIYEDEYEGFYSVSEERFVTEKEVELGDFRDIQRLKEKNYFFRMGKYQQRLLDHIEEYPEFIQPEQRRNEIRGFLRKPLEDLCISRPVSRLSWGIELPFDRDYVTYVWFDALLNYITAPGYNVEPDSFQRWWPADVHLIGKDILMTHAVYWPTMLFSAGIPLPRTIFAHGWWMSEESKISKSLGNVVNPLDLIDNYGVDPVRYYLMRGMVLGQDSSFTLESFVKRYNSDLANDFGNLLSRITRLVERNFDSRIPTPGNPAAEEQEISERAGRLRAVVRDLIEELQMNTALEEIFQFIHLVNAYMEQQAPWKLVKSDREAAGRVLYTAAEALRIAALLLEPVMPNRTAILLDTLSTEESSTAWGGLKAGTVLKKHGPLFPRIEIPPEMAGEEKVLPEGVITYDQFQRVKLKTAEVVQAEKVAGADRLLKLQVKVGSEQRQIVAGIAEYYQPEELIGRMVVIVANLETARIKGVESQGMLLAATQGNKLALVSVDPGDIPSGAAVL